MFKETPNGQTHSYNDGCGDPVHNEFIKIIPPKNQRQGQALYNFLYWLQETMQQDTFHMPDYALQEAYKKWFDENNK